MRYFLCLVFLLSSLSVQPVAAHGLPKNVHGGLTATELDLGFEVYQKNGRVMVYVTDHDHSFDTKVFDGYLEIGKARFPLESLPGGKLISKDLVKKPDLRKARLVLGAKVLPEQLRISFTH